MSIEETHYGPVDWGDVPDDMRVSRIDLYDWLENIWSVGACTFGPASLDAESYSNDGYTIAGTQDVVEIPFSGFARFVVKQTEGVFIG